VSENPISDENYATVTIRVDGHHITTFFFLHYFDMTVSEKNVYFELNVSRQCVEAILVYINLICLYWNTFGCYIHQC